MTPIFCAIGDQRGGGCLLESCLRRASDEIIAEGTSLAARALEAAEADIVFDDGAFRVAGTDRAIGILDVAALGRD